MPQSNIDQFQIDEPNRFALLDITKSNYTPGSQKPIFLERKLHGVITQVFLREDRTIDIATAILDWLVLNPDVHPHLREVKDLRSTTAHLIKNYIQNTCLNYSRISKKDISVAIDYAIKNGSIIQNVSTSKGNPVTIHPPMPPQNNPKTTP
jgi:hypothetical protein